MGRLRRPIIVPIQSWMYPRLDRTAKVKPQELRSDAAIPPAAPSTGNRNNARDLDVGAAVSRARTSGLGKVHQSRKVLNQHFQGSWLHVGNASETAIAVLECFEVAVLSGAEFHYPARRLASHD